MEQRTIYNNQNPVFPSIINNPTKYYVLLYTAIMLPMQYTTY